MQQPQAGPWGSGDARQQLAASGQAQTQQLLATAYQLLEARGPGGGGDPGQQRALQERYLEIAGALRATLAQARELQAAATAAAEAAGASGADDESDPEVQALLERAAQLRSRLEERNTLIKAAIDRLRQLLDALAMWDSSRRELAAAAAGGG